MPYFRHCIFIFHEEHKNKGVGRCLDMPGKAPLHAICEACIDFFKIYTIFQLTTHFSDDHESYRICMHDLFVWTLSTPDFHTNCLKPTVDIWLERKLQDSITNILQWLRIIVPNIDMHHESHLFKEWTWSKYMAQNFNRRCNRPILWLDQCQNLIINHSNGVITWVPYTTTIFKTLRTRKMSLGWSVKCG